MKFHDGSAFNADAVIWNLDKIFNKDCPQFDTRQSVQVRPRLPSLASYRKTGDMAVELKTRSVDSLFPYQLLWFLVSSPAQWEKVGRDWNKFASEPAGPARSSSPAWCRASAPSWSGTRAIGTPGAFPRSIASS